MEGPSEKMQEHTNPNKAALPRWIRSWGLPILILLLVIPALQPVWQSGLQQTDDGMHHLFRLFNLDLALRSGHLGARWLADEGFAYGFPVLNFYGPLSYYAGLIFVFFGAGFATTLELTLAAALILAALAMFLFARELLGPWGGVIAAVAYTWAPYHLADAWLRGALAELLAFVWIPLLMLALWRISKGRGRARWWPVLWGGAVLAGLVLTHNLTVILAAPILAGWGLLLLFTEADHWSERWAIVLSYGAMVLLGTLLSAVFWLPAIVEAPWVRAGNIPELFTEWVQRLERPDHLLAERWQHRYTIPQQRRIEHPVGQGQVVVALLGVAVGFWRWRRLSKTARWALPLLIVLALWGLFMQSELSRAIWRDVPGMLLLQFPWRWQTGGVVTLALLSGYTVFVFPALLEEEVGPADLGARTNLGLLAVTGLVAVVLMSSALPNIPWEASNIPTTQSPATNQNIGRESLALYDFGRGLWLREHGSPWMFEYMPIWVEVPREDFFLSGGSNSQEEAALDVQVLAARQSPLERRFQVTAPEPIVLQLHQFYFPGWEARIDGETTVTTPVGPLGLAGVRLPAGQHEVVFRFGLTPARRLGWALTIVGVGIWLVGAVWLRRWRWLLAIAVVTLLYVGLVLGQRWRDPGWYVPQAQMVNFDDQVQLAGFYGPSEAIRPGGENTVIFNWLALKDPATDYKVFVHVVDDQGRLWAQHDGEPGFHFSPTTRWQQGEVVEDFHVLEWKEDPPPGRYQVRAGLYDPVTGQRLPVLASDGIPTGDQVLLAEFELP